LKALDKPNLGVEHMRNERRRKEHQEKARLDLAVSGYITGLGHSNEVLIGRRCFYFDK
jgi:hypothetical protein